MAQIISNIDFNEIETLITDSTSDYFYDSLLVRYKSGDTTLIDKEYQCLYYGYTFQDEYNPYSTHKDKKEFKENIRNENYEEALTHAEAILADDPFDLEAIYLMYYAHRELGNEEQAKNWQKQYTKLIETIFSSGDGQSVETAFVVNAVRDEYEILAVLELKSTGQALVGKCDRITLKTPNQYDIEEIYFNVEKPFESMTKMFKD